MKRSALASSKQRPAKRQKSQLAMTQEIVRKEMRKKADWKYADISTAAANVTSTGTIVSLFANLARGDTGLNDFEGNTFNPQAITMKYFMHTSQVRNAVRVMLLQWFDSVTPALTGILQSGSIAIACVSPINVTNKSYIKVLYDRTHQFAPTAASGTDSINGEGIIEPVTVYIPGKRLRQVRYNATSNTVQTGNLYLLVVSDDAITPSPQITYHCRVTFTDD